ncbi:MAG: hypothetical protein B7Z15_07565 [Rhizobiales bacterium 32-66-8]|nr:MAG: hypothetical protein B7Z15_07565 [Rhizobiales bacterium 32-66-8]
MAGILVLEPCPAAAAPVPLRTEQGRTLADFKLDRLPDPGQPSAPAVDTLSLAGQVTVVHFFATWCVPCREELPALARFAERFAPQRVQVMLVNVAEVDARVRRFFETTPAPGPILTDRDRAVSRRWDVSVLPASFILAPDLSLRLSAEGEVDWDSAATAAAVRALIAEYPPGPGGALEDVSILNPKRL